MSKRWVLGLVFLSSGIGLTMVGLQRTRSATVSQR